MDLDVEAIREKDVSVIALRGEIDVYTAPQLRQTIVDLVDRGATKLVVDMAQVDFLDSTGLGVLVGGLKRLREHDGSLTPVISTTRILRILEVTGLTTVFLPQPSVPAAIIADPHWRQTVESEAGSAGEWCRQHGLS